MCFQIQELRLRDSVLTMENERLNQKLEDMKKKKKKLSLDPTNQDSQHERNENQAEREEDEENNDCNVSVENIDTIEYQIKFQLEYEKLRDVCKQWSEEVIIIISYKALLGGKKIDLQLSIINKQK